ncbi:MAG TPA: hypothetical protein VG458_07105 [Solirubrobacterales bacterium]|nr:hypothetical protein [Solirubrobacterales bacterium]
MRASIGLLAACCLLAATATFGANAASARPAGEDTEVQRPRTGVGVLLESGRQQLLGLSFPTPKLAVLSVLQATGDDGGRGLASASYAVRAQRRANGVLRADFGPIGRVAVRFEPTGRVQKGRRPAGCKGPRPTRELGRVRGTISLEGEGGYFRVSSQAGLAMRERSFRLVCRKGRATNVPPNLNLRELVAPTFSISFSSSGGNIAVLNAAAKVGGRSIALRASHEEGGPPGAEVQVSSLESGHGLAIGRGLSLTGGKGTLRTSLPGAHPATATLAPPAPFFGAASFFETSARSHSWTGSLGVHLPGLDLALTGPRFHTSLCVLSPLKSPRGCDFAKPKPLLPARLGLIPALERFHDR